MNIDVRLGEPFWRQIGQKEISIEVPSGASVGDLINSLSSLYPDLRSYLKDAEVPPTIFLNDELASMDTLLHDGDCPTLIWAVSGG